MNRHSAVFTLAAAALLLGFATITDAEASKRRVGGMVGTAIVDKHPGSNPVVRDHRGQDQQKPAPRTLGGCGTHGYSTCTLRDHRQNKTFWSNGPRRPGRS